MARDEFVCHHGIMQQSQAQSELEVALAKLAFDLAASDSPAAALDSVMGAYRSSMLVPLVSNAGFQVFAGQISSVADLEVLFQGNLEVPGRWSALLSEFFIEGARNWQAHAGESRASRKYAGKPEKLRVRVEAALNVRGLRISLHDDGAGVSPSLVLGSLQKRGVISEIEKSSLEEKVRAGDSSGVYALLLLDGVSTRDHASMDAGRGLGLARLRAQAVEAGGELCAGRSTSLGGFLLELEIPVRSVGLSCVPVVDSVVANSGATFLRPARSDEDGTGAQVFFFVPPEAGTWIKSRFGSQQVGWISLRTSRGTAAEFNAEGLLL